MSGQSPEPTRTKWSLAGQLWAVWWVILVVLTGVVFARPGLFHDDPLPVYVVTFFAWLGTGGIWMAWYFGRKRMLAMEQASSDLNLTFTAKVPASALKEFQAMPFFQVGQLRHAEHLMRGRVGDREVILMDYQYNLKGFTSRTGSLDCHQTIVVFPKRAQGSPDFSLRPKVSFWNKPLLVPTQELYPDLEMGESDPPEFFESYRLGGPNEQAICDFFAPEKLVFLSQNRGWTVDVSNGDCLVCRHREKWKPTQCRELIEQATQLLNGLLK